MHFRRRLRFRVGLAFALLGGLASLGLAVALYIASHDLEERLIDETLTSELDDYLTRRARNPHSLPPNTVTINGYVYPLDGKPPPRPIPKELQPLEPGRYQLELNEIPFRAVVADENNERFYVLFNESRLRQREHGFLALLTASVIVMTLISAAVGQWLAGRVISPVAELARRVSGLKPEQRVDSLAQDFPEDEVGELARDFDKYMDRLQAFIERERSFTADVSHELRTPLTVINGAVEVLLADPALSERERTRILRIGRSASEMAELSEALLVLAREADEPEATQASCDVEEVIRDVIDKHRALFHTKPIEVNLDVHAHPTLPVERAVLAMVVGNLVRNAYSYTDEGKIDVYLGSDVLSVSDTGRGIPEAELDHIFQRYYRGPNSKGTGIGLSLVKRVCDRYGWQIEIHSEPGLGTHSRLIFTPEQSNAVLS